MSNDSATGEVLSALDVVRHRRRFRVHGRALWIANVVLLIALLGWIFWDGLFPAAAAQLRTILSLTWGDASALAAIGDQHRGRTVVLMLVVLAAAVSLFGSFLGLFFGSHEDRRLRSWLKFTVLLALWLTLLVGWREIAWQGQRLRLWSSLGIFEKVAASLREDWPTGDRERHGLGSFMAYPQGAPRMLMIISTDAIPVSAVERTDDGALAFQLRGDPSGSWLEWHPEASKPKSFVGGLEQAYELDRAAPIGGGWYVVRYR